ncbi:MAG TPA: GNAT family N-acetyltransferase [Terriglobales bacterium]|nr:GNAT family N-acetyltransferase [Terriglobales bacterium]
MPTLDELEIVPPDPARHPIGEFDCGHADLNDFIKNDYARQSDQRLAYTKLALYQGNLVGYVTLLSDSIALHESERAWLWEKNLRVIHVAALKIGRLGTDNKYKRQGVGTALMKYAVGVAFRMNEMGVGCRFLTVDSDKDAVSFYQKTGFIFSQHREYKKKDFPNMHYDIITGPPIG